MPDWTQQTRWWNRHKINRVAGDHLRAVGLVPQDELGTNALQLVTWWMEGPGQDSLPARELGLNSFTGQVGLMSCWHPRRQMWVLTEDEHVCFEDFKKATPEEAGAVLAWAMFWSLAHSMIPYLLHES